MLKEFLPYLDQWEKSVAARTDVEENEKSRMTISRETLSGVRITGMLYMSISYTFTEQIQACSWEGFKGFD